MLHWSRISDHIGRKPVLLIGMAGLFISMLCFGLSKTFLGLVLRLVRMQSLSLGCFLMNVFLAADASLVPSMATSESSRA